MKRRVAITLIVAAAALTNACGSSESSMPATNPPAAITVPGPGVTAAAGDGVGSIGDAVEVAAGAPAQAGDAGCQVDRQTLETAMELYLGLNGVLPDSQNALVEAQLIRELSVRFEITPDGVIVPAPGSTCP